MLAIPEQQVIPRMSNRAVAYVSTAVSGLTPAEVDHLLVDARAHNQLAHNGGEGAKQRQANCQRITRSIARDLGVVVRQQLLDAGRRAAPEMRHGEK